MWRDQPQLAFPGARLSPRRIGGSEVHPGGRGCVFSARSQVLKKRKLKEEGKAAVYVEQNHRPQLMYTVEDRGVMQEAWEMTTAHREDLAGRSGSPRAALVAQDRPSVLAMLRTVRD